MLRTCANSLFSPDSRYCVDNAESTIIVLYLQPTDLEWSVDESCWIRISGILRWKRRSYSRCFFENRKILFCRFCLTWVPRFGVLDWLHAIGNGSSDVDSCILRHMITAIFFHTHVFNHSRVKWIAVDHIPCEIWQRYIIYPKLHNWLFGFTTTVAALLSTRASVSKQHILTSSIDNKS